MIQHQQRGFTLIELMAALGIGLMMLVGLSTMMDASLQDAKGQQAGQYQAQFVAAATRFLSDNYTTLLPTPTSTLTQLTVKLADLQGAGLLPANFALTNVYGQTPCMLLNKPDPTKGQIDALIVTEGGTDIPEADISYLAANAGAGGGAITYDIPGDSASGIVARGVYGGWQLNAGQLGLFTANNCSGTPAGLWHLASSLFYGSGGAAQNEFLYRKQVAGNPGINQMDAPIGMAVNALKTVGDLCSTAQIAMDAVTGNLLTCDLGAGKFTGPANTSWKAPQANYAAITTMPSNQGDVYVAMDNGRAYMSDGGGGWLPLALDNNGDLTVPGDLTMNPTLAAGKGLITTPGAVKVGSLDTNGHIWMTGNKWFVQFNGGGIAQLDTNATFLGSSIFTNNIRAYSTQYAIGGWAPYLVDTVTGVPIPPPSGGSLEPANGAACPVEELNGLRMNSFHDIYLCIPNSTGVFTYHLYSSGPAP
jgi:prepilin-type N-terminal cleavage/methylation domain-containing protein